MAGLGWREDIAPQVTPDAKREAVRGIQAAVDMGISLFDTAENYGQGVSESILGEALQGRHSGVVVVTKFGEDPIPGQEDPRSLEAAVVQQKCEASLRRLMFDCIDLYLLHRRDYPLERAPELMQVLEDLVHAGKIRYYGWSTDDIERARLFAGGEHCTAIEHRLNIFNDNPGMLELCQAQNLASLNRVPLLMGVLSGRWSTSTKLKKSDPRAVWFRDEGFLKLLACTQQIEPYLRADGRSCVQGALGWVWARSPVTIPLPGFRNMKQMKEIAQAQKFGALPVNAIQAINAQLMVMGIFS